VKLTPGIQLDTNTIHMKPTPSIMKPTPSIMKPTPSTRTGRALRFRQRYLSLLRRWMKGHYNTSP